MFPYNPAASGSQSSSSISDYWSANPPLANDSELAVGCFAWLPAQKNVHHPVFYVRERHCNGEQLRADAYKHPCIILRIRWCDQMRMIYCNVVSVTTFHDTPPNQYAFEVRQSRKIKFRESIPIREARSGSNFDGIPYFELSPESEPLIKQSYVQVQHIHRIYLNSLWKYKFANSHIYERRISEQSYKDLMNVLGLLLGPYEDIEIIKSMASTKESAAATTSTTSVNNNMPLYASYQHLRQANRIGEQTKAFSGYQGLINDKVWTPHTPTGTILGSALGFANPPTLTTSNPSKLQTFQNDSEHALAPATLSQLQIAPNKASVPNLKAPTANTFSKEVDLSDDSKNVSTDDSYSDSEEELEDLYADF